MKSKLLSSIYLLFVIPILNNNVQSDFKSLNNMSTDNLESIYLGAGCFWCVEAIFQQVNGVIKVTPGYCGGNKKTLPIMKYVQVQLVMLRLLKLFTIKA